jgi:hypothetical protein
VITDVEAYRQGVEFSFVVRVRSQVDDPTGLSGPMGWAATPGTQRGLRMGLEYSDGRRAVVGVMPPRFSEDAEQPVLVPRGASRNGEKRRRNLWLSPLPSAGTLRVVIDWPDRDMAESDLVLDADELVAAADRSEKLWDVGPEEMERVLGRKNPQLNIRAKMRAAREGRIRARPEHPG